MGKLFQCIEPAHREFIERQHIFFNASAAATGRVNVSPRDVAALRVLSAHSVVYLDRTGSGNETAAHLLADGRLTLMFCAFEGAPLILRLYGRGHIIPRPSEQYTALLKAHFAAAEPPGARQMVWLDVDSVQTSCGMNVPFFDYVSERDQLTRWAEVKGEATLDEYRRQKNVQSIDGFPTGMFEPVS
ncbi:pyridoxamine 5'-phosphate oxidase family protein [Edaphobacter flagellatus]|uniref:pyridoxamine 5'-phosphate oxidase family protein n=1 Tax=Edaphobacter flagellatus TaxID=1933044 RepID=UPI0021B33377|nr:pyridoxamine 5'-phosphate oxidase family protein [Edaphobacter flagellatus]